VNNQMADILPFKLKPIGLDGAKMKEDTFRRVDELFNITMWIGTDEQYEIDMLSNEDYSDQEIFEGIECLYAKFGIEHGFFSEEED